MRPRYVAALFAATIFFSACAQDATVDQTTLPTTPSGILSTSEPRLPKHIDEEYVSLARQILGYGGHYFEEDGTLIVYMEKGVPTKAATQVLTDEVLVPQATHKRGQFTPSGNIVFRAANYNFLDLTHWRAVTIPRIVTDLSDVRFVGTYISRNQILIGVEDDATQATVQERLRMAGIPSDAVFFETVRPQDRQLAVREEEGTSTYSSGDSLGSFAHRLQGGRVVYSHQGIPVPGRCTVGMIGRGTGGVYLGYDWLLTAAHCTQSLVRMDGTAFSQPSSSDGIIGYERYDRNIQQPCTDDPRYHKCRHGDGALVILNGTRAAGVGEIARTKLGSTLIDQSNPVFYIDNLHLHRLNPPSTVYMVGQRSGLQTGRVVEPHCLDVQVEDGAGGTIWIICEQLANYASTSGDSGAPVFELNHQGRVIVAGIHTGRWTLGGSSVASYSSLVALGVPLFSSTMKWTY